MSCHLRRALFPIRLSRRVNDTVTFEQPVWHVDVPDVVAGKNVVIIDEMADSGQTLALVVERVKAKGAAQVAGITSLLPDDTCSK